MKKMEEYIYEELKQFEEDVLKPAGQPPLDESEFDTYSALLSASWARCAMETISKIRQLAKEHPEASTALVELSGEILRSLPIDVGAILESDFTVPPGSLEH